MKKLILALLLSGSAFAQISGGGGGGGAVSGLSANCVPKAATATTITGCSAVTDDGTNVSSTEPVKVGASAPACTSGSGGGVCAAEGSSLSNVASAGYIYPDSGAHEWKAATNGSSTAGILLRAQPGAINSTAQTASISTATLCAAAAGACNVAGQYHIHFNFWGSGTACSSVTAGSVSFNLTWTDENAVAHSAVVIPVISQTGATSAAAGNAFLFQTALANEFASGDFTISTNGTVIQYSTTYTACTTGTGTYNLRATVTRVQ